MIDPVTDSKFCFHLETSEPQLKRVVRSQCDGFAIDVATQYAAVIVICGVAMTVTSHNLITDHESVRRQPAVHAGRVLVVNGHRRVDIRRCGTSQHPQCRFLRNQRIDQTDSPENSISL
jgi:hypothetical protein